VDLEEFKNKSIKLKNENQVFLKKLKLQNPRKLDDAFHELHEDVFEKVDCLTCANCCKTTSPIFRQKDIELLAKKLKCSPSDFIQNYLHLDADGDYVLNSSPCPFLDNENYCSVYEYRPTACREYPHTDRKKMYQLLDLTMKNTLVCPAVLNIVERLKQLKIK
jgi:Fe-S-cluster containining protein